MKKTAQKFGPMPHRSTTSTSNRFGTPPSSTVARPQQQTSAVVAPAAAKDSVMEMQQAIVNFAKTIAAHPVGSMQGGGQQELPNATSSDYLGGTKPFGNFLVNNYVNNAKVVGDQYVNIDMPQKMHSDTSMPNKDFAGVIHTLARIGTPGVGGGETKPDGIWQTRTNNALKQIYAVGKSLMQFGKEMGMSVSRFHDDDLQELASNIPASYTQLKDPGETARGITPIINNLTTLYKDFENSVLEHPKLKALISQNKPFADHSKYVKQDLSAEDSAFIEAHRDAVIPGVTINGKPVRITDLENPMAFKKLLQTANIANLDVSKPTEVQKYLNTVKESLAGPGNFGAGF